MITLVLGGARSGKSAVAERIAAGLVPPLTYVATLEVGDDADLAARVECHRARRPVEWRTVALMPDAADLPHLLTETTGSVLVDSLGPWVAASPDMSVDVDALCTALSRREGDTVVVSEEVGMGVHPSSAAGRRFRDALGDVNRTVAACSDEVLLVVVGRIVRLEKAGDR